jgi:16S rRNA (cytosine967-C5)-methyltransferase
MLVYSTCTLNPEENSGVADQFIRDNSDFEPFGLPLPESIRREIPERDNQITLMPQMYGTDGFFIAAFRRK